MSKSQLDKFKLHLELTDNKEDYIRPIVILMNQAKRRKKA